MEIISIGNSLKYVSQDVLGGLQGRLQDCLYALA